MTDKYKFQFNAKKTSVLKKFEVEGRKLEQEKISGIKFDVDVGINARGQKSVVSVTETKIKKGIAEISVLGDRDGDGLFQEQLEIDVVTRSASKSGLEKHKFTFNKSGKITSDKELVKGKWKVDRIERDEKFTKVKFGGVDYVVKTEKDGKEFEFELFRDNNKDGVWTKVAEGEAINSYLNSKTGTLNLVGIQDYLDLSSGVVA